VNFMLFKIVIEPGCHGHKNLLQRIEIPY